MTATIQRSHWSEGDDRPVVVTVTMTHAELDALCHLRHNLTGIAKYALVEAICEADGAGD
jgi:hypothetical protein